jgi:hypothetical protein
MSLPLIRVAQLRDRFRGQTTAQALDPQHVKQVIPREPVRHAQEHAWTIEVPDRPAEASDDLVQLVGIDVVVPEDVLHDEANSLSVGGRVTTPAAAPARCGQGLYRKTHDPGSAPIRGRAPR